MPARILLFALEDLRARFADRTPPGADPRLDTAPFRAFRDALLRLAAAAATGDAELTMWWEGTLPRERRYRSSPSMPTTTSRIGIAFPDATTAWRAAMAIPPQQGTSMRATVTLRTSERARISASFCA